MSALLGGGGHAREDQPVAGRQSLADHARCIAALLLASDAVVRGTAPGTLLLAEVGGAAYRAHSSGGLSSPQGAA